MYNISLLRSFIPPSIYFTVFGNALKILNCRPKQDAYDETNASFIFYAFVYAAYTDITF